MISPYPPIFCINLARATERRQKIQEDWCDRYGLKIEFFEAFDRRNLPEKAVLEYDKDRSIKALGREMTPGEIACATSHYLLCRKLLEEGVEEAIIMEDDAYPFPGGFQTAEEFFDRVNKGKNAFSGLKALILHHPDNERGTRVSILRALKIITKNCIKKILGRPTGFYQQIAASGECRLLKVPPWGAYLIWYNRAGLEVMVKHLNPLYIPGDHVVRLNDFTDHGIALLEPPLAGHYGDSSFIENERFIRNRFMKIKRFTQKRQYLQ